MEEELLNLIYMHQGKEIESNTAFLTSFLKIILKYEKLDDYIKKIAIKDSFIWVSDYNWRSKSITVYKENLKNYLKSLNGWIQSSFQKARFPYTELLTILLHECAHANHHKKIEDKNNNSLEKDILRICYERSYYNRLLQDMIEKNYPQQTIMKIKNKLLRKQEIYNKFNVLAPEERLATLESYNRILDILELKRLENNEMIRHTELRVLQEVKKGYTKRNGSITSPTITYLKLIDEEALSKLDWYHEDSMICLKKLKKEYPLELRITYGLSIDEEEYQKTFYKR